MGTTKNHKLPRNALEIGFGSDYNPLIFNQVGPMAVTKAYRKSPGEIHLYDKQSLYPYNYLTSWKLLNETQDASAKLERLRQTSLSLHLYGHKTRHLPIHPTSILAQASKTFRVTQDKNDFESGRFVFKHPRYIGLRKGVAEIPDLRVVATHHDDFTYPLSKLQIKLAARDGYVAEASGSSITWKNEVTLEADSPAALNSRLTKLIYLGGKEKTAKDALKLSFSASEGDERVAHKETVEIPVYQVDKVVTLMVKTIGRMDKVFALAASCTKLYPSLKIIVADDAANLTRAEGQKKLFYYLPLPYDVGLSAGRNRMIERIRTPYFLTLDDDFKCDTNSRIEELLHALETVDEVSGQKYDVAAGKNPVDEDKFHLDFCGMLNVKNKTLYLEPGTYGSHQGCHHVDFVPNLFLARTDLVQKEGLRWDEDLKLGEHEDFFLKAKARGVKVLTCPSVSFHHEQVEHWKRKTAYDKMRNRVYDFWKDSLRKHDLERMVSFGTVMMDLVSKSFLLYKYTYGE
jgi:GT2 family glycosyltransferase